MLAPPRYGGFGQGGIAAVRGVVGQRGDYLAASSCSSGTTRTASALPDASRGRCHQGQGFGRNHAAIMSLPAAEAGSSTGQPARTRTAESRPAAGLADFGYRSVPGRSRRAGGSDGAGSARRPNRSTRRPDRSRGTRSTRGPDRSRCTRSARRPNGTRSARRPDGARRPRRSDGARPARRPDVTGRSRRPRGPRRPGRSRRRRRLGHEGRNVRGAAGLRCARNRRKAHGGGDPAGCQPGHAHADQRVSVVHHFPFLSSIASDIKAGTRLPRAAKPPAANRRSPGQTSPLT